MLAGSHSPSNSQDHRVSKNTKKAPLPISMEVRTLAFQNNLLNSGVSCLPGKLNEDRYCIFNGEENNHPEYYAFGVFDGHGGTFGSELCAQKFANNVLNVVNRKSKKFQKLTKSPIVGDIADTFMCESIRKVTKSISREIKMRSITGTTCVALFIRKLNDGSFRVYCSNTGDSRCIVYRRKEINASYSIMMMSEDHGLNLQRETDRIIQRKQVDWKPLPASDHAEIETKDGWKMQKSYPSSIRMSRALALLTLLKAASSNEPESPRGSVTLEKDVVQAEGNNKDEDDGDMMTRSISIDVIDIQAPIHHNSSKKNNITTADNSCSPPSSPINNKNNETVPTLSLSPPKAFINGLNLASNSNKLQNSTTGTTVTTFSSSTFDQVLFESLVQKMLPSQHKDDNGDDYEDDDVSIDNQYSLHSPEEPLQNVPGRETSITELLEVTVHGIGSSAAGMDANIMLTNKVLNDIDSDNENEVDDNLFITAPIVHKDSFIDRRTTKDGKYEHFTDAVFANLFTHHPSIINSNSGAYGGGMVNLSTTGIQEINEGSFYINNDNNNVTGVSAVVDDGGNTISNTSDGGSGGCCLLERINIMVDGQRIADFTIYSIANNCPRLKCIEIHDINSSIVHVSLEYLVDVCKDLIQIEGDNIELSEDIVEELRRRQRQLMMIN